MMRTKKQQRKRSSLRRPHLVLPWTLFSLILQELVY